MVDGLKRALGQPPPSIAADPAAGPPAHPSADPIDEDMGEAVEGGGAAAIPRSNKRPRRGDDIDSIFDALH